MIIPRRSPRGSRGHDPGRAAAGPAAGGPPVPPSPLAPGGAGHHGNREDDPAAEAVGRVHDPRDAAARRGRRGAGAPSTAVWPDEASLSLWALPPRQLVSTLADMVESGTGGAAYYADVLEEIVRLAVEAPCGPPASTADFLSRLDANWLGLAYAGAPDG